MKKNWRSKISSDCPFKGQYREIFNPLFFHDSNSSGPNIIMLQFYLIRFRYLRVTQSPWYYTVETAKSIHWQSEDRIYTECMIPQGQNIFCTYLKVISNCKINFHDIFDPVFSLYKHIWLHYLAYFFIVFCFVFVSFEDISRQLLFYTFSAVSCVMYCVAWWSFYFNSFFKRDKQKKIMGEHCCTGREYKNYTRCQHSDFW